jgi:restriction system protein
MSDSSDIRMWGIHSQNDSILLDQNVIAIGWPEMGDLGCIENSREAFKEKYSQVYPDASKGSVGNSAGMLYRFCHEIQVGDYVVFPSKMPRQINLGTIEGDYSYVPNSMYPHQHKVKWVKHLPRTAFTQGALYELGAFLTIFSVKNYAEEFLMAMKKGFTPPKGPGNPDPYTTEEIIQSTKDYILKTLSTELKGYAFESFVADLLRVMGYKATISPEGGDSGIDITAYKDELPPRILVQVKSTDADIKETTIQSLKGAMREGDYGLFVTLSSYTKNAQKYLAATPIIRGIDGQSLVELILQYYDQLSDKYYDLIPLKKVFIPVSKDNGQVD